jgi:hypothetical protein
MATGGRANGPDLTSHITVDYLVSFTSRTQDHTCRVGETDRDRDQETFARECLVC